MQRNAKVHGGVVEVDDSWAFGQILSVVMIAANVNELAHFLFGYIGRRRKRSHERQAEEQLAPSDVDVPPASTPYRPRGLPETHLPGKATTKESVDRVLTYT